jgi:nifR3 family TIM-barrel protein
MEDVTALPMRLIAKRIGGPGLMFTEFVSAMAVHHGARTTLKKLWVHPDERPLGIQIFGGEPGVMAETASMCEQAGADLVDINMGCWVPKVCKTGSGAALLKDPDRAEEIVKAVVRAVRVPVTVKVRAGWDWSLFAAPELAKRFQDAGARMITLHARFAKQGFEGEADWRLIREMREAVRIPLVGNGDVKSPEDARRMIDETGCDGVMVGRAAISDPWRLRSIRCGLTGEADPGPPSLDERVATALEHAQTMVAYELRADEGPLGPAARAPRPEARAVRALRGQLPLYIKGEPGAAALRQRITQCETLAELEDALYGFLEARRRAPV